MNIFNHVTVSDLLNVGAVLLWNYTVFNARVLFSVGHGEDESLHSWGILLGWTQHGVVAGRFLYTWISSKNLETVVYFTTCQSAG